MFHCNDDTILECLEKRMFAATNHNFFGDLKPGSPLFLFNCSDKLLEGPFRATSECKKDMDKSAFGGKFPWQVRFELWHNDLKPVSLEVGEANEYLIQRLPYLKERYRNGKLHNPNGNKLLIARLTLTVETTDLLMEMVSRKAERGRWTRA